MDGESGYIRWFREIGHQDLPLVGGKSASLGEMYRTLSDRGVPVPNGFAVTTRAYLELIDSPGVREALRGALDGLDVATRRRWAVAQDDDWRAW